jgi:hypothetical protein
MTGNILMPKILSIWLCLFSLCFACPAGAAPPDWLMQEIQDPAKLETAGVYPLSQNRLLAVGAGRVTTQLREDRALRLAAILAENDAKTQLARHLFADTLQKESPRRFSVNISNGVRVSQKTAGDKVFVGILAEAKAVSLVPLSPLADYYDVRTAPLVEQLLEQNPMLTEGGGGIFPQDQGWVAMGVGLAALPAALDANAERETRIVAAVNARKALTEAIFGSTFSSQEQYQEIVAEGAGGALLRDWAKTTTKETVQGLFQSAEQAGEWKTDDAHLAVAVLVGVPPIRLESAESVDAATLSRFNMEEEWQSAFLQRPWMIDGGAGLHVQNENSYLLVVDNALLKGDPVTDRMQTPLLIDVKARNAAAKYLSGVRSDSLTVETEEQTITVRGAEEKAALQSSLRKLTQENVLGVVQGMRKVGSWQTEDNATLFQAYIIPLPNAR